MIFYKIKFFVIVLISDFTNMFFYFIIKNVRNIIWSSRIKIFTKLVLVILLFFLILDLFCLQFLTFLFYKNGYIK